MGSGRRGNGGSLVALSLFYPLDEIYAASNTPLPSFKQLEPGAVPEPYHKLLVHKGDMTPTLEGHYRDAIYLNVANRVLDGDLYTREVILLLKGSHKPIEYGGIQINLSLFDERAKDQILEGKQPLGGIMRQQRISHSSRPKGFFSVVADTKIGAALNQPAGGTLYGRRNTLFTPSGDSLAEIVEILAPDGKSASSQVISRK